MTRTFAAGLNTVFGIGLILGLASSPVLASAQTPIGSIIHHWPQTGLSPLSDIIHHWPNTGLSPSSDIIHHWPNVQVQTPADANEHKKI
jgi:hypothetical protein